MSKQTLKAINAFPWAFIIGCLLIACNKNALKDYSYEGGLKPRTENSGAYDVLYIQTNNYEKGRNAILAYKVYADGQPI